MFSILFLAFLFLAPSTCIRCYFGYDLPADVEPLRKTLCEPHILSCEKTANGKCRLYFNVSN